MSKFVQWMIHHAFLIFAWGQLSSAVPISVDNSIRLKSLPTLSVLKTWWIIEYTELQGIHKIIASNEMSPVFFIHAVKIMFDYGV